MSLNTAILKHEDEIIAAKEAEEAAARARDEHLADPNWKEEPVEPGDQDPNPPYREPAEGDGDDAPRICFVDVGRGACRRSGSASP